MTDAVLLAKVKNGLGITGNFQDETLQVYVDEVKAFMRSAGVPSEVVSDSVSVGCIMRGVADLWNYGSGNASFSEYFKMRVLQLKAVKIKTHGDVKKIASYFYKTKYENLDYVAGAQYYERFKPIVGACSVVSKGNLFGRNYDWLYDDRCMFVVETSATDERHATLGVAGAPYDLTTEVIDSGADSESYKILPFMLVDGINDAGLICEVNVVPSDKGLTFGTNVDGEDLFALMIPRFVLDYASDVDEAIELLQSRNIYCAYSDEKKQEYHFMLSDGTKTAVVEFVNNEMVVIDDFVDDQPIMTNFFLSDYDGTRESLTPYAMGIERHAILSEGFSTATSESAMISLMRSVLYTKTYDDDVNWYSEFAGDWGEKFGNLTKDSLPEEYAPIMQYARKLYRNRKRDGATWQTVHTTVYNIEKRKMIVIPQESNVRFSFSLTEANVVNGE